MKRKQITLDLCKIQEEDQYKNGSVLENHDKKYKESIKVIN